MPTPLPQSPDPRTQGSRPRFRGVQPTERSGLSTVGEGRALAGLDTFAYAFEAAIEGDDAKAGELFREADSLWVEVGTPFGLAVVRATMAQLLGRDSELGRHAAKQAFAFLDGAGMQGYIELFPDVFAFDDAADEELAA